MRTHGEIDRSSQTESKPSPSIESAVRAHFERVLSSPYFDASTRSREIFRFIMDEALAGRGQSLCQQAIAKAVFHRDNNFNAVLDPIVRVQVGRLRRSLERLYLLNGDSEPIRIEIPKGAYAPVFVDVSATNARIETLSAAQLRNVARAKATSEWPTIVIHSFERPASQPFDALAAHLKDQLAMELNRYDSIRVARARDVSRLNLMQQALVRFELRGSLRVSDDGHVVTAHLVDRTTGEQLWSDEYAVSATSPRRSRSLDDVIRAIAARIGAEHGVIMRLLARERHTRTDLIGPFSAILRCNHIFLTRQVADLPAAIDALEQLTAREPEIAIAWTSLARLHLANYAFELSGSTAIMDRIIGYASQGVAMDPASIRGACVLAQALLVKGELASAREELDRVLQLHPDSLAYREVIGWLLALTGDWERGMHIMRDVAERNPFCLPYVKHGLWADHLLRGEFDKAYVAALEYSGSMFFWRELMCVCCLGHLGRASEANAGVMELLHAKPNFAQHGRRLIGYYIKSNELRTRIIDGLHKAGLFLD